MDKKEKKKLSTRVMRRGTFITFSQFVKLVVIRTISILYKSNH